MANVTEGILTRTKFPVSESAFSQNWKQLKDALKCTSPKSGQEKFPRSDRRNTKNRFDSSISRNKQGCFLDGSQRNGNAFTRPSIRNSAPSKNDLSKKRGVENSAVKKFSLYASSGFAAPSKRVITKYVALDCEYVQGGTYNRKDILGRVSIVNFYGDCVYDTYVKPTQPVQNYITHISGIRPTDLETGKDFSTVTEEVSAIIKDRIVIGHALQNDFKVLRLNHPRNMTRDTSCFLPFKSQCHSRHPSLRKLAKLILNVDIQTGEHDSIEDARTALQLYRFYRAEWEKSRKREIKNKGQGKTTH